MNKNMLSRLIGLCGCLMLAGCGNPSAPTGGETVKSVASAVVELNDMNFVAQTSQGVVLVDFWAPWCGPCRMQGPIVEKVAEQIGTAAKVAKLNVDDAPQTAQKFGVRSIPTLIVFKDGKPLKQFVGVTQADDLIAALKE